MNLEAIALTVIFAIVLFGLAILLGVNLVWANKYESRLIKTITRRNARDGYPPPEEDD